MGDPSNPHDSLPQPVIDLLRQRAQQLASTQHEPGDTALPQWSRDQVYLCFKLLDTSYGLPLSATREAIPLRTITHLPGAPGHILGLTRLRGSVLPLVDLRFFWQHETIGYADNSFVVVVEANSVEFGIVCNSIEGLIELASEEITEVPKNLPARQTGCLLGLARHEILLINPSQLVDQPGFCLRQRAASE